MKFAYLVEDILEAMPANGGIENSGLLKLIKNQYED